MSALKNKANGYVSAMEAAESAAQDNNAILADVISCLVDPVASYAERINSVLEVLNDSRRVAETEVDE